jgi:hypothetical protein
MRATSKLAACLALCLLLPACSTGPKPIKVKGTVVYNGKPYMVDTKGSINLTFVPIVDADTPHDKYPTRMNKEDATFVVLGRNSTGIPPGKYRIAVNLMVPNMTDEMTEMNAKFTEKDSPIVLDIAGDAPVLVDLAK